MEIAPQKNPLAYFTLILSDRWYEPRPFRNEQFREFRGVRGSRYCVSTHGRVLNADGQILRPFLRDGGINRNDVATTANTYFKVIIDGKAKYIHRLVYETFRGPIPHGYQIDHGDMLKFNNNISNLRAVTPRENRAYTRTKLHRKHAIVAMIARTFAQLRRN